MSGHSVTDNNYFNSNHTSFRASDIKAHSSDPAIRYQGFLNKWGDYVIEEQNDTNGTWRFYRGSGNYTTAWAARESLSYGLFNAVFGDI